MVNKLSETLFEYVDANVEAEDEGPEIVEGETKAERFKRLGNKRLPAAVKRLRLLANLSSSNYEYTQEQVSTMFAVLEAEMQKVFDAFSKDAADDNDIPLL